MNINDILKPVYPVKEYKSGAVTTRIQYGPEMKVTRSISFAGREIPLTPITEMLGREEAVREPTVTTTLSPAGRIEAVRGKRE